MDRYRAVTDMRLDWRSERVSWDDMVFWRVMGWKDEDDEVEVREAGWSIVATGILWESTGDQVRSGEDMERRRGYYSEEDY